MPVSANVDGSSNRRCHNRCRRDGCTVRYEALRTERRAGLKSKGCEGCLASASTAPHEHVRGEVHAYGTAGDIKRGPEKRGEARRGCIVVGLARREMLCVSGKLSNSGAFARRPTSRLRVSPCGGGLGSEAADYYTAFTVCSTGPLGIFNGVSIIGRRFAWQSPVPLHNDKAKKHARSGVVRCGQG